MAKAEEFPHKHPNPHVSEQTLFWTGALRSRTRNTLVIF
jgi:hypothetical protein